MKITLTEGKNALNHLRSDYDKWFKSLPDNEKKETHFFAGFVLQSVRSCNQNNGTIEDLIFIAEDAICNLKTN